MVEMQFRMRFPPTSERRRRMSRIGAPVLIINGTEDHHTTIDEARASSLRPLTESCGRSRSRH